MPLTFEERLPEIQEEIRRRRSSWILTTMDWEDASQIILIRVWNKYHLYDEQKAPFQHWINTLITSAIKNIWRDKLTKFSRPCILGCRFNLGNEECGFTQNGKQCSQCPLFASWKRRKESHFNVAQTLPIENHIDEVNNRSTDFFDIDGAKSVIDIKMRDKLKPYEHRIYVLLYVEHRSMEEVGKLMKYKKAKNSKIPGYQTLAKLRQKYIQLTKEIIAEEGLV